MNKGFIYAIFLIFFASANAFGTTIDSNFGYQRCNYHKFTFLFMKIYDTYLCFDDVKYLDNDKIYETDFSLAINYDMNFKKDELSESSIEEMNRYYEIPKATQKSYYQELMTIFPNVKSGDIIEARYKKQGVVEFYHNQKLTGKITTKEFSRRFLDIWLHRNNKYQSMIKDLFKNE